MRTPTPRLAACLAAVTLAVAALPAPAAEPTPSYKFDARLQLDHDRHDGLYSTDGTARSETYLRRATAGLSGRLHRHWDYELEAQVDGDASFSWRTAAVAYTGLAIARLQAGRMKPEFGLEESISSKWVTGIERSAIWDLAPDAVERSNGIAATRTGDRYRLSLAGYRRAAHDALVARAVITPLRSDAQLLHLGLSHADERIDGSNGRIRSRLGVQGVSEGNGGNRSTLAPSAGAGAFDGDRSWVAEFAWALGPWSLQSEWLQRRLDARTASADREASGLYVQLAWTLTGEPRPYDIDGARFEAIRPGDRRWGAWELVLRHDQLRVRGGGDLADPAIDTRASVQLLGVNWYVNRSLRLSANVLRARSDRPDNDVGSRDGDALSLRLQWVL